MRIDTAAVQWSAPERERDGRPLLLLLHGLGSHEGSMFERAPQLPAETVIASVRAPLPFGEGWAWFERTDDDEQRAAGADAAANAVLEWLDSFGDRFSSVGALGMSQGGAMTMQLLRNDADRFDYVVNLSGFANPVDHDGDAALNTARPPVFWAMGTEEDVINPRYIAYPEQWLPRHSTLTHRMYEGLAHAISAEELADASEFIRAHLR